MNKFLDKLDDKIISATATLQYLRPTYVVLILIAFTAILVKLI